MSLRIVEFSYEYPPLGGGGGIWLRDLCLEMAKRHSVTVITSAAGSRPSRESEGGVDIVRVPVILRRHRSTATMISMLSYFPSSLWRGRKWVDRLQPDVVNSQFVVPSGPSAHLCARRAGVPHVVTLHGGDLFDPSKSLSPHRLPVVRSAIRFLLKRADRVVAQSSNTAGNAKGIYGVDRPIDIIPLGIQPIAATGVDREALGIGKDRFVLVSVGRLIRRKNLGTLLEAVRDLGDASVLLVLVGSGPLRDELETMAASLGIADQIKLTGWVEESEKIAYLENADLYVSTSDHEGFGLVFVEAMDCGLPVVAYDHGGQTDFLKDGETGALVSHGNRDELVAAIRQIRGSTERLTRYRATCKAVARGYYIERCAESYEELFSQTVSAHRTSRRRNQSKAGTTS